MAERLLLVDAGADRHVRLERDAHDAHPTAGRRCPVRSDCAQPEDVPDRRPWPGDERSHDRAEIEGVVRLDQRPRLVSIATPGIQHGLSPALSGSSTIE